MKSIRFTNDRLNQRVLQVIKDARPTADNTLSKAILCTSVYGYYDLNIDRKVKDAITELRNQGEPIGTVKGGAGYCYGWEYIDDTIADYKSRGDKEFHTARILEHGLREYRENKLREQVQRDQPVREAVQMDLLCWDGLVFMSKASSNTLGGNNRK